MDHVWLDMGDGDNINQVKEEDNGIVALGEGWTCISMGNEDGTGQVKKEGEGVRAWQRSDTH